MPTEDPGFEIDPGTAAELERQKQYAAKTYEQKLAAVKALPPFTETGPSYRIYEIAAPQEQRPSVLVFVPASSTRTDGTRTFRVGADVTYRVVEWEAVRRGDWPQIPKVDESAGKLIRRTVTPHAVNIQDIDGVPTFRISGRYVYVFDTPKTDTAGVAVPKLPNLDLSKIAAAPDAVVANDQSAAIAPNS